MGKKKLHVFSFIIGAITLCAQEKKETQDSLQVSSPQAGQTENVMLNASSDNGPRIVNIGLPTAILGGTIILENGLPVTYDYIGQFPTSVWRQDNGIARFDVLNTAQTALFASDVGVSVSTWTNKGTNIFRGAAQFTTNSFGLLRGDVSISGPIKNNFYYSLTAYVNMDPGTFRANFSQFLDKTQIYKGVINKKYNNGTGEIGVQYKFAYSESIPTKQSPYIYRKNGKVDALPGFRIGKDSYLEQSGKLHIVNPITGKEEILDAMKDLASISHIIDVLGSNKFSNGMIVDYTLRYHYAKSGLYNPIFGSINDVVTSSIPKLGDIGYFYADNPQAPYNGLVQSGNMSVMPQSDKNTLMGRVELNQKINKHDWAISINNWYYNVDRVSMATYGFQNEVVPNPKALITKVFDGTQWVRTTDQYGNRNYNVGMLYYNGWDNKMAIIATDKWEVSNKLSFDLGTRLELRTTKMDWYPAEARAASGTNWVSGQVSTVSKDWFNTSFTGSGVYKIFDNAGLLAEAMYIQQSGPPNAFSGADNPFLGRSEIPGYGAGVYFNHPIISIVSKMTQIKRTKFINNLTFVKEISPGVQQSDRQNTYHDVKTIGWTTDLILSPLKGFKFHMLLTLQDPKYENFHIQTMGDSYNYDGNVARSVSKTIIELDPSYTLEKFRLWASARYFSKEYANYPNNLIFAERWETFAGIDFKYDKNIDFSISLVNLLNQNGAQGYIAGSHIMTDQQAQALYNKPTVGTYIRPFTIEFATKIKF